MTDFVSFTIRDGDTLVVTGRKGSFSGCGIALEYESILQRTLRSFVSSLRQFPGISTDLDIHGPGLVRISVKQIDAVGHIVCQAELSESVGDSSVDLRLMVDYETVARFATDFEKLIDGTLPAATITGVV